MLRLTPDPPPLIAPQHWVKISSSERKMRPVYRAGGRWCDEMRTEQWTPSVRSSESNTSLRPWRSHMMRSPLLVIFLPALVQGGICELSYCHCEDTEVICEGTGQEQLFLSSSSLPPAVTSFTVSSLNSLHIKTNAFNDQEDMKEFRRVVTMFVVQQDVYCFYPFP